MRFKKLVDGRGATPKRARTTRRLGATADPVLALTIVVVLSGCVTAHVPKQAPTFDDPIRINVVQGGLSGFTDLPVGFHRIPDSQLVMTGHKKKGNPAVAFLLFGVIGVIMHVTADDDQVEALVREIEDALRLTVAPIVQEAVLGGLESHHRAATFGQVEGAAEDLNVSEGPVLDLDAALVLSFDGEETYRAHAVIKASLRETANKSAVWRTRYFSSSGQARGLFGTHGWSAGKGELLRDYATAEFGRLVDVILDDVASNYRRSDDSLVMVRGHFPYMKQQLQTVGYLLGEDEQFVIVHPQLHPQFAFAGVQILEKSNITYRPAQSGDPVYKLLADPEATGARDQD